jgi:hypothetical protein
MRRVLKQELGEFFGVAMIPTKITFRFKVVRICTRCQLHGSWRRVGE